MSKKIEKDSGKRPYTQRARARRHDEVHRRITKAAVYLHGTVGPAQTTMKEIADRAGVRRATIYNHFATDRELFEACSSHWFQENPPPDPTAWAKIADPVNRCETAVRGMYEYFDHGQEMLERVLRDSPQVPVLEEILRLKWQPLLEGIVEMLAEGWSSKKIETNTSGNSIGISSEVRLRASIRVVLDFFTWQTLTGSGMSNDQAARVATSWIRASG